ncbi:hypothetical protein [Parelusimicrobium proximum]|uniref:tetratricopeptide repeat protein n=1 Tax=Parelusimicrobium proximum TaxID=3228953 RepID=UPI003D165AE4
MNIKKYLSVFLVLIITQAAFASEYPRTRGKEAGMILDLQKFSIGTLNNVEDKKQYLSTIQLEKQRIQNYTLNIVYENAYILYKRRDYQRAQELAQAILTIDPDFNQARILSEQAYRMGTYGTLSEGEIVDAKMEEGKRLYKAGRLAEADRKFGEVLVIQPRNSSALSWQKRVERDIANEYERRGDKAYSTKDYEKALDQWYSALILKKEDKSLLNRISKTENIIRTKNFGDAMKEGVTQYNNGKLIASYNAFQKAVRIQPSEPKAQQFSVQVKKELADGYANAAGKAYNSKQYDKAIANWKEAKKWGYDPVQADKFIRSANKAKDAAAAAKRPGTPARPGPGGPSVPTFGDDDDGGFKEPLPTDPKGPEFEGGVPLGPEQGQVSEENRRLSVAKYQSGLVAYNNEDYETAKREWQTAVTYDPGNTDASLGLKKIQEIMEVR